MKHNLFIRYSLILAALALAGGSCSYSYPAAPTPKAANEPTVNRDESKNTEIAQGTKLELNNQGLTKLPDYVLKRTDLQELNISNNKLTGALPAEIRFLSNLQVLNMSHNSLTGVPAEVGQLNNLQILDLSYNQLTGLPYEIGNLKNLKKLILTGNNYSEADLAIILQSLPNVTVIK